VKDGFCLDVEIVERVKEVGVKARPLVAEATAMRKEREEDLVNMFLFVLLEVEIELLK